MQEQVQTLVDAGRLDEKLGEKVSQLEPGVFCLHKSWGPGVIKEWDLFGDKMVIDFEGKLGHGMQLQFAANSLEALDNDHIFAKFVGNGSHLNGIGGAQLFFGSESLSTPIILNSYLPD